LLQVDGKTEITVPEKFVVVHVTDEGDSGVRFYFYTREESLAGKR
jgi:hypothetical protein